MVAVIVLLSSCLVLCIPFTVGLVSSSCTEHLVFYNQAEFELQIFVFCSFAFPSYRFGSSIVFRLAAHSVGEAFNSENLHLSKAEFVFFQFFLLNTDSEEFCGSPLQLTCCRGRPRTLPVQETVKIILFYDLLNELLISERFVFGDFASLCRIPKRGHNFQQRIKK